MIQKKHLSNPLRQSIMLVLVAMCAGYTTANAQSTDNATTTHENGETPVASAFFDPIVITATRSEKRLSDAPVAIQVLDKTTLDQNHAHTLKEALQLLPNVYLAQVHGKTGYEVRMQGFTGEQVLVLVDGLPISTSTGSTFNISQYLNTEVEQIEVIQGAASVQYGSSAMGGVVNIITKPIDEFQGSITAELASNGSQNPSDKSFDNNYSFVEGSIEGALSADKRLRARLSASYRDDDGLKLDPNAWETIKGASEQKQIHTRLSFIPNANEVSSNNPSSKYWLEAGYYEEDDVTHANFVGHGRTVQQQLNDEIERKRISVGGQTSFPSADETDPYRLTGSVLYEKYNSLSNKDIGVRVYDNRDFELKTNLAQFQLDLPSLEMGTQSHAVQVGLKYQKDDMQQVNDNVSELLGGKVDRNAVEAYVQDDWMLGENSELVVGVRYQDDSKFGSHAAPKLAFKQNFYDANNRKHVFKASVGQGYRVPNLKELYFLFDHSRTRGYKVLGNQDLKPEESTSYQIGYQSQLTENLGVSANGFYNDVKNLIQTEGPVFEGRTQVYQYANVAKAKTYGGDIALDWSISPKANLNFGYAYLKAKNKTTNTELTGNPEHKATARLDYQLTDKLQLINQVRYESKSLVNTRNNSYSPSWWGVDSRANYSVTPNLDVYMAVNNVFDEQRDFTDANDIRPIDNRQWLLGASYNW